MNDKLVNFIKNNYKPSDGAKSPTWSIGNGDDQFYDGVDLGRAQAFHELASIMGIEVEPLAEQEYE